MASAAQGPGIPRTSTMSDTEMSSKGLAAHPEVETKLYMNKRLEYLGTHNDKLLQDRTTNILPKTYHESMEEFTFQANQYANSAEQPYSNKHFIGMVEHLTDITQYGLNGESLAMRGFLIYEGDPDRIKSLAVLTGGLHGSEARIAIKAQCDLLKSFAEDKQQLPPNTAILFIPAVNPWGASYSDRCNQNNVDLNRNFPTNQNVYDPHPSGHLQTVWEEMNTFMNPDQEQSAPRFYLRLIVKFIKYLVLKLITQEANPMPAAIAGGQNLDRQKLFYGGTDQESNTKAVIKMTEESLALFPHVTTVLHNDDHTGLAKKGAHSVEVKASPTTLEEHVTATISSRLEQSQIPNGYQVERPSSRQVFYSIDGDITDWFMGLKAQHNSITHIISVCQEVGTINCILGSEPPALQALSAALWRKNNSQQSSPGELEDLFRTEEYTHLRETFCPDDDGWARQGLDNYRDTTEALLTLLTPGALLEPASKDLFPTHHDELPISTSETEDLDTGKLKTA